MGALRDFVADMLESEGAAVEPVEPDGLDVLAPEPLRAAMGWPELARLGFGAELPSGAMPIGLEGDWLDRFGALLGERGRFAERQLVLAGAAVGRRAIPSACSTARSICPTPVWRLHDAKPAWTRCLLLAFRYHRHFRRKARGAGLARLQSGHRRGHRRRHSGAAARAAGARRGLACARAGRAPRGGRGLGRGEARGAGPAAARSSCPARSGALPARHAPPARPRPRRGFTSITTICAAPRRRKLAALAGGSGRKGGGRPQARDHAGRRHRARICRQARRSAPQLRFAGDGRLGAGAGALSPRCIATRC